MERPADSDASDIEELQLGQLSLGGDGAGDAAAGAEAEALPEHACAYCGNHDEGAAAKCLGCRRWFCNGRGNTSSSHIIWHLVRAHHREVQLHPKSQLGETTLECYNCGARNVFSLGFIPAKRDTVVVILCRACATAPSTKDMIWDPAQWQPLIHERQLISWVVRAPSAKSQQRDKPVTSQEIRSIEEAWSRSAGASSGANGAGGLDGADEALDLQKVLLRYSDAYQYQSIFGPLVNAEADHDRRTKEAQTQDGVAVRWETSLSNRKLAYFRLSKYELGEVRLAIGDELRLSYSDPPLTQPWSASGCVAKLPNNTSDEICMELSTGPAPTDITAGFSVDFVWKSTTFDRMLAAMKKFTLMESSVSEHLYHRLLGHDVEKIDLDTRLPKQFRAPGLPELNASQIDAIRLTLRSPLSLIQGPPGTGKTVTTATLVYHLAKANTGKVLVCAPSNVAVDQLTEKVHQTGLRVARISARNREELESRISHLELHTQALMNDTIPGLQALHQRRTTVGELSSSDQIQYRRLRQQSEMEILRHADVILCTCVGAGDRRLSTFNFRTVLIDESTQASEPECLIPLVLGARQVVLIGDHQQLGPVILSKPAAAAGLSQSLFERLVFLGIRPHRLVVQYRMHPCLSEFPSNFFYEGSLQNGVTAQERTRSDVGFPWPNPARPMMTLVCNGIEEIASNGTSYINRVEASACEKIVTRMLKAGVKPEQIGVITPYEGQRSWIVHHMSQAGTLVADTYKEVEMASVDAFQGREKDYIIVSCVRNNEHQGIGFLSDPRRLNVALTRAKYGMIILGSPKVLSRNPLWHELLSHYKHHGVLVEGQLGSLVQSTARLSKPRVPKGSHMLNGRSMVMQASTAPGAASSSRLAQLVGRSTMRYIPPDLEAAGEPGAAAPQDAARGPAVASSLYQQFFGGAPMPASMLTQASYADHLSTQLFSQDLDLQSQNFTQHDTVLLGGTAARGAAARDGSALPDNSNTTFHPRMHASIMFSQSDQILVGGEQPGLSRGFFAQEPALDPYRRGQFDGAFGSVPQAGQSTQPHNFTQY
ncbi:ATP-dependent RNA helicase [Coemansia javaensis]|uniref:ATP-dependent RNA helicase n=1 Tax=Coemansia javaensis TaxID=2761396 RepID=A0A9W8H6M5_9FUNG|nr:ATP-dependent RNA helicase [Coemansia javaensis]